MDTKKAKADEAEATIYVDKGGNKDLVKKSLVYQGKKHLTDKQMMDLFSRLRLRFTLTPQCNLWCTFCSNEGSTYSEKGENKFANISDVILLSDLLIKSTPLRSIDFSGGEPTIHPDFTSKDFKLLKWTKKHEDVRFSIHSNGINLDREIVDQLSNFSRIGISVHSLNFKNWNLITNMNGQFSLDSQKRKFNKVLRNLKYLSSKNFGDKVFLKSVVMRGINDSEEELELLLKTCKKYGFHPKLLQFEPQYKEQAQYIVGREELFNKLIRLGCLFDKEAPFHNKKDTYIPGVNFKYPGTPLGLHSIFGCGDVGACKSCYRFLCMFVKSYAGGSGLFLKPCSVLNTEIDLTHALRTKNTKELLELFKISREYLMLAPGINCNEWNKEEEYRSISCPKTKK